MEHEEESNKLGAEEEAEVSLLCTERVVEEGSGGYDTVIIPSEADDTVTSDPGQFSLSVPANSSNEGGQCQLSLVAVCGLPPDTGDGCYSTYSGDRQEGPGYFSTAGQFQPVNLKVGSSFVPTAPPPRRSARCAVSYRLPTFIYETGPGGETLKSKSPRDSDTPEEPAPHCRKKSRTLYSLDQLQELERMFVDDHYPDSEKRREIAENIGVTPQRIMVWFQNRRAKWRKVEKTSLKGSKKSISSAGMTRLESAMLAISSSAGISRPENVALTVVSGHHTYAPNPGLRNGLSLVSGSVLQGSQSCDASSQQSAVCSSNTNNSGLGSPSGGFLTPSQEYPPTFSSPPPLRRVGLPMSMTFNPSSYMVPLMLDTPESTCTPPPSSDGDLFAYSMQESPAMQEQMGAAMRFGAQYYHHSNQPGPFQLPQYAQYPQYTQYQRLPVHNLTPTSPEENAYLAVPGTNSGVLTYGSTGAFLQGQTGGHILLQPGTGGISFQASPWSDMYIQSASFPCPRSQIGGTRYLAEQSNFPPTAPRILQHPKPAQPAQTTSERDNTATISQDVATPL